MDVSEIVPYPQIIHFNRVFRVFHYKPSILGYLYPDFRKNPQETKSRSIQFSLAPLWCWLSLCGFKIKQPFTTRWANTTWPTFKTLICDIPLYWLVYRDPYIDRIVFWKFPLKPVALRNAGSRHHAGRSCKITDLGVGCGGRSMNCECNGPGT